MSRKREQLPARLTRLQRQLDQWRKSGPAGRRIPDKLWKQAERCAVRFGVSRTAIALRLNYDTLKRRIASAAVDGQNDNRIRARKRVHVDSASSPFVELPSVAISECTIEAENAAGDKVRLALRGSYDQVDITTLVRGVWER